MNFTDLEKRMVGRYRRDVSRLFGRRMVPFRFKHPIVSFTFDDFPKTALHAGGAILRKYGAFGTFYAAFGLMGKDSPVGPIFSPDDIKLLLEEGHELGCHTFAHCHAWDTAPAAFEESILENRRALQQLVPGAVFKTHSYPISCPRPETKRRAGRYFSACRAGGQVCNLGKSDLNGVSAFFLEKSRNNPDAVKNVIQHNEATNGWLVLATHDVCSTPTPFGCAPDFFENVVRWTVESRSRVLAVGAALEAMKVQVP
jgi:peptidoglycan/xylan/chitin deacetylase (PgdA/CDA1 family)